MPKQTVTLEDGQVRGKILEDYLGGKFYSFLGIPYGKPPVGPLRFKAPLPVEPWTGIRDATREGKECPSRHLFLPIYVGSESDCLNLNVYTPKLPKDQSDGALKAVMVWIHGGGFTYGSNTRNYYGPDYLITEDVVLVSINYRLGALGFLCLEDTSLGVPGNAGLKDMVLALKWVQRNIHHFSGDPNNVTIFGESAGGAAVHYLVVSPLAKGLFHKAIAQSGCVQNVWARGKSNGKVIADLIGCHETDERKILQYLQKVPVSKVVKAQNKMKDYFHASAIRPFTPVLEDPSVEDAFMTIEPFEMIKAGNFNKVPMIMGYMSNEGLFFEMLRRTIPYINLPPTLELEIPFFLNLEQGSEASREVASKIEKFYFGDSPLNEETIHNFYLLKTDTLFLHGIHRSISYHKLKPDCPIYMYRMSLETSVNYFRNVFACESMATLFTCYFFCHILNDGWVKNKFLQLASSLPRKDCYKGACHADDVGYLFKSLISPKLEPGTIEDLSIKRFVKMWTNFAKTSNPTPDPNDQVLNIEWKPVSPDDHHYLEINHELKMGVNPDSERMQFWDSLYN